MAEDWLNEQMVRAKDAIAERQRQDDEAEQAAMAFAQRQREDVERAAATEAAKRREKQAADAAARARAAKQVVPVTSTVRTPVPKLVLPKQATPAKSTQKLLLPKASTSTTARSKSPASQRLTVAKPAPARRKSSSSLGSFLKGALQVTNAVLQAENRVLAAQNQAAWGGGGAGGNFALNVQAPSTPTFDMTSFWQPINDAAQDPIQ